MESTATTRRANHFIEENYGLASIAAAASTEMEAVGSSGNHFLSRPLCSYSVSPRNRTNTNTTLRNLSFSSVSVSSPRSARFYDSRFEEHMPHFLDSCSFCNKPIGDNRDIFMYRFVYFFFNLFFFLISKSIWRSCLVQYFVNCRI